MKGMLVSILGLSLVLVASAQLGRHDGPGCAHYEFDCGDGQCIEMAQMCDGEIHCTETRRDENNDACPADPLLGAPVDSGCPSYEFNCYGEEGDTGAQCIAIDQICDGTVHCDNGRDENNQRCPMLGHDDGEGCALNEFDCNEDGYECVTVDYLCDSIPHCTNGRDENNLRCPAVPAEPTEVPQPMPEDGDNPWDEDWDDMDDGEQEEPELFRCNRELCDVVCPLGHVTDIEGCPTCQCITDPCAEPGVCGRREVCKVVHCDDHPCTQAEAECVEELPCPMPMCRTRCDLGYKNNEHGCMTCECNEEVPDECEGYECPANHMCLPVPDTMPQHMVETMMGRLDAICLHASQMTPFLNRWGSSSEEMSDESDDSDDMDDEDDDDMPFLCHQAMEEMHRMPMEGRDRDMHRAMQHNCHPDGSFKPTQCNFADRECWCANDAGEMIEGTHRNMEHHNRKPECQQHHTVKTEIIMVFDHNIQGSLDNHYEPLTEVLTHHLSVWTGLGEELIDIKTMRMCGENGQQLKVFVELTSDGLISLPLIAATLLRNMEQAAENGGGLVIEYEEFILTPVPDQFVTQHTSHPIDEPVDEPWVSDSSEEEDEYTCTRIFREHGKGLLIVTGICLVVLMFVTVFLVYKCCIRKRRAKAQFNHQKMDKYKENIAYNNDMMARHPDVSITEKGGKCDAYKVIMSDNQEEKY